MKLFTLKLCTIHQKLICIFFLFCLYTTPSFSQQAVVSSLSVASLSSESDPEGQLEKWISTIEKGSQLSLSDNDLAYIKQHLKVIRKRKTEVTHKRKKAEVLDSDHEVKHFQQLWNQLHYLSNRYYTILHTVIKEQ